MFSSLIVMFSIGYWQMGFVRLGKFSSILNLLRALRMLNECIGEDDQKEQTFSYKINKFQRCNIEHGDYN